MRVVDRALLDARLTEAARRAGAIVREGQSVTALEPPSARGGPFVLHTREGGRFEARDYVVGADGASSLIGRTLRGPVEGRRPAVGLQIRVPYEDLGPGEPPCSMRVHFGLVPWGYGWVFPAGDHAVIGIGAMIAGTGGPALLRSELYALARASGVPGEGRSYPLEGAVILMQGAGAGMGRGRVFLCGDAAGLVDRVSGEGIPAAVESGLLCASAILDGGDRREMIVRAWRGCLGRTVSSKLCGILLYHPRFAARAIRRLGESEKFYRAYWELLSGKLTYGRMILGLATQGRG